MSAPPQCREIVTLPPILRRVSSPLSTSRARFLDAPRSSYPALLSVLLLALLSRIPLRRNHSKDPALSHTRLPPDSVPAARRIPPVTRVFGALFPPPAEHRLIPRRNVAKICGHPLATPCNQTRPFILIVNRTLLPLAIPNSRRQLLMDLRPPTTQRPHPRAPTARLRLKGIMEHLRPKDTTLPTSSSRCTVRRRVRCSTSKDIRPRRSTWRRRRAAQTASSLVY